MPSNWFSTSRIWKTNRKYSPITKYRDDGSVDGEKGELLDERDSLSLTSDDVLQPSRKIASRTRHRLSIGLNIILILTNFALVLFSWPELVLKYDKYNNGLLKRISKPSPILNQMHVPLVTQKRNGSLLPQKPPHIFSQEPSDEVDAAWNRIANINPISLTAAEVRGNGYDPNIVAQWPEVYGLGDDAYVGRLDVFHQIHCLNMIRKSAYYDYYYESKYPIASGGLPPDQKIHLSHCFYALLQELQCSANTDPFIHYWVDVGDEPYPDFSITRQCKNFEAVLEWQEKNSVPMSEYRDVIRKPLGVTPKVMSDEYKYMVGLVVDSQGKEEVSEET